MGPDDGALQVCEPLNVGLFAFPAGFLSARSAGSSFMSSRTGPGGRPPGQGRQPQARLQRSAYCASSVQERICSFGSIGKKGGGALARLES